MREIVWAEHSNKIKMFYITFIDFISDFKFEPHSHKDFIEFMYICNDSSVKQIINGRIRNDSDGCFMLFRPQDWHEIKGGIGQAIVLRVKKDIFTKYETILEKPGMFERIQTYNDYLSVTIPEEERSKFEALFRRIGSCTDQTLEGLLFIQLLAKIFSDFFYNYLVRLSGDEKVPGWFNWLLIELQKKDIKQLKTVDLSKICGYSKEHIARTFRRHFKKSPSAYINDLKLEKAANMLTRTDNKLLYICYESGFENVGYFHKLFKAKYGCTPNEYRFYNVMS